MLWLAIEAPFAVCRPMMAGWHRPTAGFLTHSAAYGLILNVAGVESRLGEHEPGHPGGVPASVTRAGLPSFRLALGIPEGCEMPRIQSLYQQIHSYLQDNTKMDDPSNPGKKIGKQAEGLRRTKGNKYHISPVRRELLSDVRAIAIIEADDVLIEMIRGGLKGWGQWHPLWTPLSWRQQFHARSD